MSERSGMTESQEHRLGGLLARVAILERDLIRSQEHVNKTLEKMDAQLSSIQSKLDAAGGSWRTLVAIGTLVSIVSGAIGAFFAHR